MSGVVTDEMRERWRSRVAYCRRHVDLLSAWELDFVDSLDAQLDAGHDLSFKQSSKLAEVYHGVEDRA